MTERRKRRLVSGSLPPLAVLLGQLGTEVDSVRFRIFRLSSDSYGHRAVAKPAHGLVPVGHAGPFEVRTMGAHPEPAARRMTPEAIGLLVAGDAAFQVLPGRLRMTHDPEALAVVERSDDSTLALDSDAQVTITAKRFAVMAAAAVTGPPECLGSMRGQEVHWMEFRRTHTVVALRAGILCVARHAIQLTG